MRIHKPSSLFALGLALSILILPAGNAAADDWKWMFGSYVWGSGTTVDIYANDEEIGESALDFDDLIDKIDFSMQLHAEGRKDSFGLLFDLTYLDTGDKVDLPEELALKTDVKTTMLELGGFYRPSAAEFGLDVLFGARVVDLEVDLELSAPGFPTESGSTSETITDGFLGLRYSTALSERWFMALRGDAGTGDTDFSYNLAANFGYKLGKTQRHSFVFGYRHFVMEFKDTIDGVDMEVDMTMSGPQIGLMFGF